MNGALLILPDFCLILFGLAIRRWLIPDERFWAGLEKLVYFVLFPALLFGATARTHIDLATATPLVASGFVALLTGMMLGLLGRRLFADDAMAFASQFQCGFRFNSYIGLAVAAGVHGQAGVAAMGILIGAMVPIANFASVWMLARHRNMGLGRELARNPLILGTLAGLAWNGVGLPMPGGVSEFLTRLSQAAIILGLMSVGAALRLRRGGGAGAWYLLVVKMLAVPAVTWFLAPWLGLTGALYDVAVLFAALPTASSAYILAMRMGGDGRPVAWLISAGTLAGMLTLPLWIGALGATGKG